MQEQLFGIIFINSKKFKGGNCVIETLKILTSVIMGIAMILTALLAITKGVNERVIKSFSLIFLAMLLTAFSEEISTFLSPYFNFSNFNIANYLLSMTGVIVAIIYLNGDRRKSYEALDKSQG